MVRFEETPRNAVFALKLGRVKFGPANGCTGSQRFDAMPLTLTRDSSVSSPRSLREPTSHGPGMPNNENHVCQ